jgi:hypothetical protein
MSNHTDLIEQYEMEQKAALEVGVRLSIEADRFELSRINNLGILEFQLRYSTIDEVSAFIEGYIRAKGDANGR